MSESRVIELEVALRDAKKEIALLNDRLDEYEKIVHQSMAVVNEFSSLIRMTMDLLGYSVPAEFLEDDARN